MKPNEITIPQNSFRLTLIHALAVVVVFFILVSIELFSYYNGFLSNFYKISQSIFGSDLIGFHPYNSFSICLGAILNPLFLFSVLILYVPFYLKRKESDLNNPGFENYERWLVSICAFVLSWELCTYDYNYYLDNGFYLDRIILLALPFIIFRIPLVIPVFIAFSYVYRSQFNYPVDGFMLIDKRILWDVLTIFLSVWYVRLFIKDFKIPFLFFAICLVGSNYFFSAMAKVFISPHGFEWLAYNNPADLFVNIHLRGFMANASENTISSMTSFIDKYGMIFQFIVFLIELAAIFIFYRIRFSYYLLGGLFLMHLGIFTFGSMLFWKWMIVDITLLFILIKYRASLQEELFSSNFFRISLILILSSFIWMRPAKIAWVDTPYTIFYSYEGVDENGRTFEITKNQMDPYHQWIQYDRFYFLVNEKLLPVSGFGYTDKFKVAKQIKESNHKTILDLEKKIGINKYNRDLVEKYEEFIQTFFANKNKSAQSPFVFNWIKAPFHIYNYSKGKVWDRVEKVTKFRVFMNKVYTENGHSYILEKKCVFETSIPL